MGKNQRDQVFKDKRDPKTKSQEEGGTERKTLENMSHRRSGNQ